MSAITQDTTRNRLLRALAPDDFAALRPHLEAVDLPLRTVLAEPGRRIEHLHFLEAGIASVVVSSEDDAETIEVGNVGREGITGTTVCLGVPVCATRTFIQVAGNSLRLSVTDYSRLAAERPEVGSLMLRYLHTQQMQVAYSALANARYDLGECLARWLLMSHDRLDTDDLPLTHEFLSLMIGVRRAGVTNGLILLESMGVVKATRGRIRLLDRERLVELASGCYGQPEAIYDKLIGPAARAR